VIATTLCGVALLSAFGPWGAYGSSERAQTRRFREILAAHRIQIPRATGSATGASVPLADRRELSAIIRYLNTAHGPSSVARLLEMPGDTVLAWRDDTTNGGYEQLERHALERLGLVYVARWATAEGQSIWLALNSPKPIPIAGFELLRPINLPPATHLAAGADTIALLPNVGFDSVVVTRNRDTLLVLDVQAAVRAEAADWADPSKRMLSDPIVVEGEAGAVAVRLVLETAGGQLIGRELTVTSVSGFVLIRGLEPER